MTLCRSRRRQVVEIHCCRLFCWAHNPKVGGSNPPPATKESMSCRPCRKWRGNNEGTGSRNLFPFRFCHHHFHHLSVSRTGHMQHRVPTVFCCHLDGRVTHQLLLNFQRKPQFGEPCSVGVPESMPAQLRQTDLRSGPVQVALPHCVCVVRHSGVEIAEQPSADRQFSL